MIFRLEAQSGLAVIYSELLRIWRVTITVDQTGEHHALHNYFDTSCLVAMRLCYAYRRWLDTYIASTGTLSFCI